MHRTKFTQVAPMLFTNYESATQLPTIKVETFSSFVNFNVCTKTTNLLFFVKLSNELCLRYNFCKTQNPNFLVKSKYELCLCTLAGKLKIQNSRQIVKNF